MAEDNHAAVAGAVDFVAIGIPSELKISNPSTPHYRGAIVSAILWGMVIYAIVANFFLVPADEACANPNDDDNHCVAGRDDDAAYGGGYFANHLASQMGLGAAFLIYVIESCCSDSRRYMSNFKGLEDAEAYLAGMIDQSPDIVMTSCSYHYETRIRYITETDSNGYTRTRTETYTVKVVTHRAKEYFAYEAWKDESGPFHGLSLYAIVKLKLFKLIVWNNDESYQAFLRVYAAFQARHRWRDTHFDHNWDMRLPGFKRSMLALTDPDAKPWWLSLGCFAAWTLVGASWCWRRFLTNSSVEAEFTFKKVIQA